MWFKKCNKVKVVNGAYSEWASSMLRKQRLDIWYEYSKKARLSLVVGGS